jgi:hypothetical protein
MSISFVAPRDFHQPPVAPAPETFELLSADKTAFARLFPFSLAAFKTGLAGNLPGFNFSDNEIKMAAQAIVQAGLIGGGASAALVTVAPGNLLSRFWRMREFDDRIGCARSLLHARVGRLGLGVKWALLETSWMRSGWHGRAAVHPSPPSAFA